MVWCRKILQNSPMAIRLLKSALNAVEDGHAGLQVSTTCPGLKYTMMPAAFSNSPWTTVQTSWELV